MKPGGDGRLLDIDLLASIGIREHNTDARRRGDWSSVLVAEATHAGALRLLDNVEPRRRVVSSVLVRASDEDRFLEELVALVKSPGGILARNRLKAALGLGDHLSLGRHAVARPVRRRHLGGNLMGHLSLVLWHWRQRGLLVRRRRGVLLVRRLLVMLVGMRVLLRRGWRLMVRVRESTGVLVGMGATVMVASHAGRLIVAAHVGLETCVKEP